MQSSVVDTSQKDTAESPQETTTCLSSDTSISVPPPSQQQDLLLPSSPSIPPPSNASSASSLNDACPAMHVYTSSSCASQASVTSSSTASLNNASGTSVVDSVSHSQIAPSNDVSHASFPSDSHLTSSMDDIQPTQLQDDPTAPDRPKMDHFFDKQHFSPLYSGAEISFCGAMCALMQFSTSNKLSYTAIDELLKLLHLLLPNPNCLPNTFHYFKKFFKQYKSVNEHKLVCTECMEIDCSCESSTSLDQADLVYLDIDKPLKTVITRNWTSLQLSKVAVDEIIRDVWDGSVLKKLRAPNRFFSNEQNLALSLFTDGVPLYKSSHVSMWPVYLVVLNLPVSIRANAENVILCGLWVGPKKPSMNLLIDPVVKFLESLSTSGLPIDMVSGVTCTLRAKLVFGVFDLPAKAAVLNAKQFNGMHGCSVCLHPGKRLPNNARVYLPDKYPDRVHADVVAAAITANNTNSCVEGVFGVSPLSSVLDLVESFPIDYMHCVLEGVTKWLLKAWFDSKFHHNPFYIGRHKRQIDNQFCSQRPPKEFSRPPRSITKHLNYWKASEFKQWLLFYSLPLLLNHLPSLYWHHLALLVCAMHILLGDQITLDQIDAAELMIGDFCDLLPELYGETSCTANAHLLSHLVKFVRLWGPLWMHSAFSFESKNGKLKYLFHGRRNITHQLLFNIDVSYTLQHALAQLAEHETGSVMNYINSLAHSNLRSNMTCICSHTYAIGPHAVLKATMEQSLALGSFSNLEVFTKLFKDGIIYSCTQFEKPTSKRNDTNICYNDGGCICFGEIQLFVANPNYRVLVRKLKPSGQSLIDKGGQPCRTQLAVYQQVDLLSSYIVPVETPDNSNLEAISMDRIISKVVTISISGNLYCVRHPNSIEIERH